MSGPNNIKLNTVGSIMSPISSAINEPSRSIGSRGHCDHPSGAKYGAALLNPAPMVRVG